jgi:hypothetical protein
MRNVDMTDQANTTDSAAPASAPTKRAEQSTAKSSYRPSAAAAVTDSRTNGGSGVQRSHLRDRKRWLKGRTRAGRTWAQRKVASVTYCPAKTKAG